ncbi:hypothetical protein [Profundibacter sp.]
MKAQRRKVSIVAAQILKTCEKTGEFAFNSRHFCAVGEYELAFDGIYRFVEGNSKFKAELGDDYIWLKSELCPNKDFSRHPIYNWES